MTRATAFPRSSALPVGPLPEWRVGPATKHVGGGFIRNSPELM